MTQLPQRAKVALARHRASVDYMKSLRCQCRVSKDEYCYGEECARRLFTVPGADGVLPATPCGLVATTVLGKERQ